VQRREFVRLLGGAAAAWPLAARAQQLDGVWVGFLSSIAESDREAQSMVEAFHQTLQELGWVEGRNLRIDHRWAGTRAFLLRLAPRVVSLRCQSSGRYWR
jgi:putative ABC transport system substrate-binding protein